MNASARTLLILAAASLVLAGCSSVLAPVTERVDQVRETAADVTVRAGYCVSAARAAANFDESDPQQAMESLTELLDGAPDELDDLTARLEQAVSQASDGDLAALDTPEMREVADQLMQRTMELCDPRS